MPSFFEKLKRGMGIEIGEIEKKAAEKPKPARKRKPKKIEIEAKPIEPVKLEVEKEKIEEKKVEEEVKKSALAKATEKEKWFEPEGQLAIDVYQTDRDLVIQSAVAGIKPENLDISIENDQILIKGSREKPAEEGERNYFYQECYWGPFSRQIILPEEVDPSRAEAAMKEGILTIRIPKIERKKRRKIVVKEE